MTDLRARFWSKVDKTDKCWVWTGAKGDGGYGRFWHEGRGRQAHRFAWESVNGPIPAGLFVCHTCDNPPCVKPGHLFLGTNRENMHDALAKGRINPAMFDGTMASIGGRARGANPLRGEAHPRARLTERDVREVRRRYALGESQRDIAKATGISRSHVGEIVRRERWSHV